MSLLSAPGNLSSRQPATLLVALVEHRADARARDFVPESPTTNPLSLGEMAMPGRHLFLWAWQAPGPNQQLRPLYSSARLGRNAAPHAV